MATLYFYGLNDGNLRSWQTASYWKTTDSPTGTASATIPASGDDVVIRRPITSPPTGLNLNSITINIPSGYSPGSNSSVLVNLSNCKNLTTTSGIHITYANQLRSNSSSDSFPGQLIAFSNPDWNTTPTNHPASGLPFTTVNSNITIDINNAAVSTEYTSDLSVLALGNGAWRRWPWHLKINGNISVTGVPVSGRPLPYFYGYSFPSGNVHLENVRTWGFFADISQSSLTKTANAGTEYLSNSNSGYNIYCSGCIFDERKYSLTTNDIINFGASSIYPTWYQADVSGVNALKAKNVTFINCQNQTNQTTNRGNAINFGSQLESLIITNSTMNNTEPVGISGSPNITLTNSSVNFRYRIPSTGNITCINSSINHLNYDGYNGNINYRTLLNGSGSYIYLDGTSKLVPYYTSEKVTSLVPVSGYTIVSQYPNTYPVLASGNYTLSYSGYPSARTLYFNNAVDNNILTSGNWWNDNSYTSAASEPALPLDNVIISGSITVTDPYTLNYNSLTLYDSNISTVSSGIITINQGITLNGSSSISGPDLISVNSGIVVNGTSYINGSNLGPLGIYGSGSLVFNDDSKYIGDPANIKLTVVWNGLDGWDATDSIYYIGGQATSLDSNGNGYNTYNSTYYLGGVATTLDSNGSGFWNGHAYYYANLQPTGWNDYYYYINDVQTTLDSLGSGFYDGHAYYYGNLQPTGWNDYYFYVDDVQTYLDNYGYGEYNGLFYSGYPYLLTGWDYYYYSGYYIDGVYTYLDMYGSGFWNGHAYYNGSLQPTGYNGYYYYVDDVETTLDSNAYGSWNGLFYSSYPSLLTGYDGTYTSAYYIEGVYTTLDYNGSGFYDGHAYYYGNLQPTGWNDYFYYIDDVETTLDSSGNGNWDGYDWVSGVRQVIGTIFNGATDADWDNLGNWIDANNYTATSLPSSINDIIIRASVSTAASEPTVNSIVVEQSAVLGINITSTTSITFNNSSSCTSVLTCDTIVFNNFTYANSATLVATTSVTFNNSSYANSVTVDSSKLNSGIGTNGNYILITGFPIVANSLNYNVPSSNPVFSFSRAGLGANGSNILGII